MELVSKNNKVFFDKWINNCDLAIKSTLDFDSEIFDSERLRF